MATIKNLTGKNFYDCELRLYKNDNYECSIQLGNFLMGDTREVTDWRYQWRLLGYDDCGDIVVTDIVNCCNFYKSDLL